MNFLAFFPPIACALPGIHRPLMPGRARKLSGFIKPPKAILEKGASEFRQPEI